MASVNALVIFTTEIASLLVPIVGDISYEVCACLNNIISCLMVSPFMSHMNMSNSDDGNGADSYNAATMDLESQVCLRSIILFFSFLLRSQPSGLDAFDAAPGLSWLHSRANKLHTLTNEKVALWGTVHQTIGTDYGVTIQGKNGFRSHTGFDSNGNSPSKSNSRNGSGNNSGSNSESNSGLNSRDEKESEPIVQTRASLMSRSIYTLTSFVVLHARHVSDHVVMPLNQMVTVLQTLFKARLVDIKKKSVTTNYASSSGIEGDRDVVANAKKVLPPAPRRKKQARYGAVSSSVLALREAEVDAEAHPVTYNNPEHAPNDVELAYKAYAQQTVNNSSMQVGDTRPTPTLPPAAPSAVKRIVNKVVLGIDSNLNYTSVHGSDGNSTTSTVAPPTPAVYYADRNGSAVAQVQVVNVRSLVDASHNLSSFATPAGVDGKNNSSRSVGHDKNKMQSLHKHKNQHKGHHEGLHGHKLFDSDAVIYAGNRQSFLESGTYVCVCVCCPSLCVFVCLCVSLSHADSH